MAWQTPKTNWQAADVVSKDDFNRIEGNAQHLKDTKVDETEFNLHANNKNNPHNVTAAQVGAAPSSHTHDNRYYTESEIDTKIAAKVDKPTSAVSGNIAVFDGGAGKIKDGGIATTNIRTSFYKASGHTQLTFPNIPKKSASPVREISIPVGSRVGVWLRISYDAIIGYAAYIETTPGVRGSFDSIYFAIRHHAAPVVINQGANANSSRTNQDGDFEFNFDSNSYLYFKYLTNNKLMFFVYNNHSSDTYNYTLDVYWHILD